MTHAAYLKPRYRASVDYDAPRPGYVLAGPARRVAEVLQLWVLPFVGWPLGFYLWLERGYDATAVAVAMVLPVLIMMAVVYWGTQRAERWTFPVAYAPNGYLPQIGVIYAATLHLVCQPFAPLLQGGGLGGAVAFVVGAGLVGGAAGCLFDYFAIRHDILRVYVKRFRAGERPGPVVLSYGPAFFTTVAVALAIVTVLVLRQG